MFLNRVEEEIVASRSMLALEAGWDSYGALPITETCWQQATEYIRRLAQQVVERASRGVFTEKFHLSPCADGGIGLQWVRQPGSYELLINVHPDASSSVTFYGHNGKNSDLLDEIERTNPSGASDEELMDWLLRAFGMEDHTLQCLNLVLAQSQIIIGAEQRWCEDGSLGTPVTEATWQRAAAYLRQLITLSGISNLDERELCLSGLPDGSIDIELNRRGSYELLINISADGTKPPHFYGDNGSGSVYLDAIQRNNEGGATDQELIEWLRRVFAS